MADEQEMISVIVPVYNVEKYLEQCLRSITMQTYGELEIILVDDGSSDQCPSKCDKWAQLDSRIKVIHKKNGGLSDARNTGMALATGQYISFIDSDDWIAPEMLERLIYALKRDKSDIAVCGVQFVREDGSAGSTFIKTPDQVLNRYDAQAALLKETLLKQPVWYKLYRRELIRNISFEVGRYHEDVFWSYQAVGNAERVSLIEYIGYFYRQRNDSIMGRGYSLKRLDALTAYCRRYDYLKEVFPKLAKESLIRIWRRCIYEGQLTLLYLSDEEKKQAFQFFKTVRKNYPIRYRDYSDEPISQMIWIMISRISLRAACYLRNLLKIGF